MTNKFTLLIVCLTLLATISLAKSYLTASNPQDLPILNKEVYIQQDNGNYYFYKVYSQNGNIQVQILDKNLKKYNLTFDKQPNTLYFRAAYNKYIIVQEKNSTKNTISYWILTILTTDQGYKLDNFAVQSRIDDQGYMMNDDYLLTDIIEYDRQSNFLYVITQAVTDYDVYEIYLTKKTDLLKTTGWFNFGSPKQNIVGGNSRVLVDATTDQILIDTKNPRPQEQDPTIYEKVNISSLTKLPIYKGGSRVSNFLGSYFQYVSVFEDGKNMTTFIYHGDDKAPISAEGSLNSTNKPIRFFSDEQTFFVAVSDNDVYASAVVWNESSKSYNVWSNTVTGYTSDKSVQQQWVSDFYSGLLMVFNYHDQKFYFISEDNFYAYSQKGRYVKALDSKVSGDSDIEQILIKQIEDYRKNEMI